jgi:hypothetical protein
MRGAALGDVPEMLAALLARHGSTHAFEPLANRERHGRGDALAGRCGEALFFLSGADETAVAGSAARVAPCYRRRAPNSVA